MSWEPGRLHAARDERLEKLTLDVRDTPEVEA
jgi:hypothetical protein